VNANLTVTEWRNMVAEDVLSPEEDLGMKNGSEPQPGNEYYFLSVVRKANRHFEYMTQ
jgi:hypothetical protein